ncbi:MAG TPA: capsular biosynthesis protein [Stellaceae bacterium]|nr:capsular biosynthesis protein [Stellaceae bacterium]
MPDRRSRKGAPALSGPRRSFLFLQGPQSAFFERVARALTARGHRAHRVNLNLGDRLFWRLPATDFRGHPEDWPDFIARLIEERGITDLILLGDRRPYHVAAAEAARAGGAVVWVVDLGYVRPGWLTFEPDGSGRFSHFPRDPAVIRALAKLFPAPGFRPVTEPSFLQLAVRDVAYNAATMLGRPLYPHYRRHGLYHPFAEYAGWVKNAPRRLLARRAVAAAKARLAAEPGSYFLFPLQLATDFALRAHSPFTDARDALRTVLDSFADSGSERRLAVVGHPLDEGLIDWRRLVAGHRRALFLEGGVTDALVANAAGVVTVNSTVGLTALRRGLAVKTLGAAIYDVAGLTHSGDLAGFWRDPRPPDPDFLALFLRALIGATQINGGYYTRAAQEQALPAFVARLEQGPSIRLGEQARDRTAATVI